MPKIAKKPQRSINPQSWTSYLRTTVNANDGARHLIQQVLDLETGRRPLSDFDIQRALMHQTWGRSIAMVCFSNAIMCLKWELRKIESLRYYFRQRGIELAYQRAREYWEDYKHHYRPTVSLVDEDEECVALTLLHRLQEEAQRLQALLLSLTVMMSSLTTELLTQQRRYTQLQHAHAELTRDFTLLHQDHQLRLVEKASELGLVINQEHYHHLFNFHTNSEAQQQEFITLLCKPDVYPHNTHLTAEDIRNLLFHGEITKILERFQNERQGFELRLNKVMDDLYGCRMQCHKLETEIAKNQKHIDRTQAKLHIKQVELEAERNTLLRAENPNPVMNNDISVAGK